MEKGKTRSYAEGRKRTIGARGIHVVKRALASLEAIFKKHAATDADHHATVNRAGDAS